MNGRGGDSRRARMAKLFGDNVRRERERQGLSQREFARKLGTDPADVSRMERGLKCPRLDSIDEIAEALNVSAMVLVAPPRRKLTWRERMRQEDAYVEVERARATNRDVGREAGVRPAHVG